MRRDWKLLMIFLWNGGRKMSEKRFECDSQDVQFSIVEDDELILANPTYVVNLLNSLQEENEQLKQQLLYDGDDICGICKHEYLTPSGDYFIGKCEKGHEEYSKRDIRYCEDFKLKELEDE